MMMANLSLSLGLQVSLYTHVGMTQKTIAKWLEIVVSLSETKVQ